MRRSRIAMITITALVILFSIFILQNVAGVKVSFLVWNATVPTALLMIICAALGFVIGLFAFRQKKTKPTPLAQPTEKEEESTSHTPS